MILIDEITNWSFDLSQYDSVWKLLVNIGLVLIFLLIGNAIRRVVPFLRKAHIPSALLGGLLLFLFDLLFKAFDIALLDKRIMQIITYHALAIGFIAMTLKIAKKDKSTSFFSAIQNGAITGATYMLQASFGILVSLIFFWASSNSFFYDAGVLLPLGYGQGPGNALTWDINFTNMENSFTGAGSVGLTIASIGFIVASVVGIIYINIFKKKGQIVDKEAVENRSVEDFEEHNEIEDSESVDKSSIQIGLVFLAYALAFGIMIFFYFLSKWTGVALFNSVAWGFNFIWGVITANIIKLIVKLLKKKNVIKKKYINNYQMDRISGFAFDLMILAGVAAIDIEVVAKYVWFIVAVSIVGAIITIIYVRIMTKISFKGFEHEAFLTNFGTLTGTASNGMIFLREIDPNYETPMSNIFIVSQLPAMIFVAPLLLLLNKSAESINGCYLALGIFFGLFILYTVFLVLAAKGVFAKKQKSE